MCKSVSFCIPQLLFFFSASYYNVLLRRYYNAPSPFSITSDCRKFPLCVEDSPNVFLPPKVYLFPLLDSLWSSLLRFPLPHRENFSPIRYFYSVLCVRRRPFLYSLGKSSPRVTPSVPSPPVHMFPPYEINLCDAPFHDVAPLSFPRCILFFLILCEQV